MSTNDWTIQFGVFLHRRRVEVISSLIKDKRHCSALEVACGNGILQALGVADSVGIDIHPGNAVLAYASAEYLPIRSQQFDLVFAGEILEHLERPAKALSEWVRVLQPKGTMIISTPNGLLVDPSSNPEHKRTYSPEDLVRSLEKMGMRVVCTRGIFTGLVSGRRLFRLIFSKRVKMLLLRLPIPLPLSYDVFVEAIKA